MVDGFVNAALALKQVVFNGSTQLKVGLPSALPCHSDGTAPALWAAAQVGYETVGVAS